MGDFNFGDRKIENDHIPAEHRDCWKEFALAKKKDYILQGTTCGGSRLDKILFRADKKEWKIEHFEKLGLVNMPSDHLGILTRVVLQEAAKE